MTLEDLIRDNYNYTGTAIVDLLLDPYEKEKEKSWQMVKYSGNGRNVLDTILFKCPYCGSEFNNRSEYCSRCGKKVE